MAVHATKPHSGALPNMANVELRCRKMLINAFGFQVIAEEDGAGYRRYEEGAS